MRYRGIIGKFDDLSRIAIPKEYLDELAMKKHEPVKIMLTSGGIVIKKSLNACKLCGNEENLMKGEDFLRLPRLH